MNRYIITPVHTDEPVWTDVPALSVDTVLWLPDSGIRMQQQMCYDAENLSVRQQAWEQDIRAVHTGQLQQVCEDAEAMCADYERKIEALGGVDIQLLGIGHDGHIGFNEPGDSFVPGTNCVALTEKTIEANSRFFDSADEVPKFALTMGIRAIMQAKEILMVVNGADKAEILEQSFFGPITPAVPASILQLHPNVILCADDAALSGIRAKHPGVIE